MVFWGATFNAMVAVGVVSLLLFRLPLALLWIVGKIYLGTGMMVEIVEIGKCELARAAVTYDWYCHLM